MRMRHFQPQVVVILFSLFSWVSAPSFAQSVLWDNGGTDGSGAVSNRSKPHRSLLDDFVVPVGQVWQLSGFQTWGIWNHTDPPAGKSFELTIWSHVDDHPDFPGFPGPDQPIAAMIVTGYDEQITGQRWFSREEVSVEVGFEPFELQPGKYWLEMHMLSGNAQFFQMERLDVTENSYWVDYEDFGGLQPSGFVFGEQRDLAWNLCGELLSDRALPDGFVVVFGSLVGGDVESLHGSDDTYIEIQNRPAPSFQAPVMRVEIEGHTALQSASQIVVTLEAASDARPARPPQRLQLFDYQAAAWVTIDERTASFGDSALEVVITDNPTRFIAPKTGGLRTRIDWFDPGPTFNVSWGARVDQAVWTVMR